jgi:hypothetical protein
MKNLMVAVSMATTLAFVAGAPGNAIARGRWQDIISPASHGHARVAPVPASVERQLLEGPRAPVPLRAAATRRRATAPQPEPAPAPDAERRMAKFNDQPRPSRVVDHAAGDRLREALAAAQDDPKSVARINRLIAAAAAEARRNKALGERVWYWRDPFAPNPRRAIVLSLETQLEMQLWQARQEAARARIESVAARHEAAMALVEAARARSVAARAQGPLGRNGAMVARQNRGARTTDDDAAPAPAPRRFGAAGTVGVTPSHDSRDEPHVRRRAPRSSFHPPAPAATAASSETALARNEAGSAGPSEAPRPYPPTVRSRDPRGIVVVPINTPVAALPRKH